MCPGGLQGKTACNRPLWSGAYPNPAHCGRLVHQAALLLEVHIHDSFILQDNWTNLEKPYGSIFLSIPTVLDSSLAPEGHHILHIFTTSSIEDYEVKSVHSLSVGSNLFHIYVCLCLLFMEITVSPFSLLGTLSERL